MEDAKLLPGGAVWDYYCARKRAVGEAWLRSQETMSSTVLA